MIVVFDLDGTLIDSVGDLAASASEMVTTLGGRALDPAEVAGMVGDGAGLLVRRALEAAELSPETPDALGLFLEIYGRRLLDTTVPYEGVAETLSLLSRRARLAVLTNKPVVFTQRILDAFHLSPAFERVIGGDGHYPRKPSPEGLLTLVGGSSPALMVGDSPVDWATAVAAGCGFAWAKYGFGADRFEGHPPETPYTLERASDLIAAADRFAAAMSGA